MSSGPGTPLDRHLLSNANPISRASGSLAMSWSASGSPVNGRLVGALIAASYRHASLARGDGRRHEIDGDGTTSTL